MIFRAFAGILLAALFAVSNPIPVYAANTRTVVWNFDEPSGSVVYDASGKANNGTLLNSPARLVGGGLSFNGTNQYVRSTNAIANSLGVANQAYTVAAKVRIGSGETAGNIIHVSNMAAGSGGWCTPLLVLTGGKFQANSWQSGTGVSTAAPSAASEGQWYSVATTWDPTSDLLKLYVDGVLVASTPQSSFDAAATTVYVMPAFGTAGTCAQDTGYFKGDIKDVVVDSTALTAEQIAALAASNEATIYANAATGNDSTGEGTQASPVASFHRAYLMAHAGDTIDLSGTFTWTDSAEGGDVATNGYVLSKNLSIEGYGADTTVVRAHAASSTTDRRVFTVSNGSTVDFSGLSIQNGNTTADGGGVLVYGTSAMDGVDVYNNRTSGNSGGGVSVYGSLLIENSTVRNNTAYYMGGGLLRAYYGPDGSNASGSTERLDIVNTTVAFNRVMQTSAYLEGGGVYYRRGNGSITNSTIAYNQVVNGGTSKSTHGLGAAEGEDITVTLKNNIIAANYLSTSGGDIGLRSSSGTAQFVDSGGNVIGRRGFYPGLTNVSSTTWLDSTTYNGAIDGTYVLQDGVGATSGTLYLDTTLANNDTQTGTVTLALTNDLSIAVDAGASGSNGSIAVPSDDQRGVARAGSPDAGAYERGEAVDPDAPIAHWKFDEGSGTTAIDSAGSYTGTISGATHVATSSPDILFDDPYSLNFDGVNDGVSTSLSLNNMSSFTLAGWAYPRTAETAEGWFGANDVFEFMFGSATSLQCWTPHGAVNWTFNPSTFLNEWHHITCIGDGDNVILYVDGEVVGTTPHAHTTNYGTGDNFSIGLGVQNGGSSGPFDGLIDDVRVYARALSPEEMFSLGTGTEEPVSNPIVSSFAPADDAIGVALDANLTITFSTSTIATSTGNIGIYKAADDSLVESIAVTGGQLSKSGAAITIDPSGTFVGETEYYVSIPGTAFKDAADRFYAGTVASTTWSFTTGDFAGPVISNLTATSSANAATITWDTDENASTRVAFGPTAAYGSYTTLADTSPRVTSHAASLSGLVACTTYHYAAVSADAEGNTATSTDGTFKTTGCVYDAEPDAEESGSITSASGGSVGVTTAGKTFMVSAPANATATSSSFVIQVQAIPNASVLETLGRPNAAREEVGLTVFDVTAIVDGATVLDSFDAPITISYEYADEEVEGLDESSLWLYHYHDAAWEALDDCDLDMDANTISCTTESFSLFGLFGSAAVDGGLTSLSRSRAIARGGIRYGCKDPSALNFDRFVSHREELCVFSAAPVVEGSVPVRDLELGAQGPGVLLLQKLLNANGFALATSGLGSTGNETEYFGSLTKTALSSYQAANGITPSVGYFGPLTRAQMKGAARAGVWW